MIDELTLNVLGMTCGGCENAIKRVLSMLDGVVNVTASHRDNRVTVAYDAAKADALKITRAIETAGYQVTR